MALSIDGITKNKNENKLLHTYTHQKTEKKTGENCNIHGLCRVSNLKDLN